MLVLIKILIQNMMGSYDLLSQKCRHQGLRISWTLGALVQRTELTAYYTTPLLLMKVKK